eukprot:COSAG01_NODE_64941_length_274_cov_40.205714_2_plen_34_part_01
MSWPAEAVKKGVKGLYQRWSVCAAETGLAVRAWH